VALASAWGGDSVVAKQLAADLKKRFALDTLVNEYWLPTIQARIQLANNDPAGALASLQPVLSPMELGFPLEAVNISCLYPVYTRGEAYLAARQSSAAAREFQKILDHGGIVQNCATGALARLGLARAYALEAGTGSSAVREGKDHAGSTGGTPMNRGSLRAPQPQAVTKARAAYQDFLTLWENADPDIPILKQAKAEYAKLQ
jgi:hypothetical protein